MKISIVLITSLFFSFLFSDNLDSYLEDNKTSSFILFHEGEIKVESEFEVQSPSEFYKIASEDNIQGRSLEDVASIQKSVVSLLIGIAQQKGFLDINDSVSSHLGPWTRLKQKSEQEIKIVHLLSMNSGLDESLSFKSLPGASWFYNTKAYSQLIFILERVTNKDIQTLSKEWLFDVIGMTDTYWQERSSKWSSNASRFGLVTSARDLLELGRFVLNGGEEGDLHVIEDIDFFDDSFKNSQNGNLAYGYLWWLTYSSTHIDIYSGKLKNKNLFPDAPEDTILALGAANRILAIVPSKDLIMVRLGDFPKDSNFQNNIWLKF